MNSDPEAVRYSNRLYDSKITVWMPLQILTENLSLLYLSLCSISLGWRVCVGIIREYMQVRRGSRLKRSRDHCDTGVDHLWVWSIPPPPNADSREVRHEGKTVMFCECSSAELGLGYHVSTLRKLDLADTPSISTECAVVTTQCFLRMLSWYFPSQVKWSQSLYMNQRLHTSRVGNKVEYRTWWASVDVNRKRLSSGSGSTSIHGKSMSRNRQISDMKFPIQ